MAIATYFAYLMQARMTHPPLWIKFPADIAIVAGLDPAVIYRIRKYLFDPPTQWRIRHVHPRSLPIHVDDTYLATTNRKLIEEFKAHLQLKFTITWKDTVCNYLGVQHTLEKDARLKLSQQKLLNDLFDKMNIASTNRILTPSVQFPPRVADPDAPCDATE
jgi:hypothetical protein